MNIKSNDLRQRFRQVFHDKWADEGDPRFDESAEKFVFHMADATDDLRALVDSLQSSGNIDVEGFGKLLHRFFLHAVPHLVSAGQLYDYVPEIFPEQRGVHGDPALEEAAEFAAPAAKTSAAN